MIVIFIALTRYDNRRVKFARQLTVANCQSHLILSCSFRSSICLTSSRFSDERVHQLQMSMRHASRSPPTRRGGHLPPPTLIPSIPITRFPSFLSFASYSTEHTYHVIAGSAESRYANEMMYVSYYAL